MTIDDQGQGFTPKQKEELTQIVSQLLKSNGIDPMGAKVQCASRYTNFGKRLGVAGKWVAYLANTATVSGAITIFLFPAQVGDACNWYAETSEIAFNQACEVLGEFNWEGGERHPGPSQPSGTYIAYSSLSATTTPEPPPIVYNATTGVFSASGVSPKPLNHPLHPSPPSGQSPRKMFG